MLSEKEKEHLKRIAEKRYSSKRNAGISNIRSDGSVCSLSTDLDATGAEFFAAKILNQSFDSNIYVNGDAGYDFKINNKSVEVIWLGRDKRNNLPRKTGNLIVNPHEPKRWANIYVVVKGGFDEGYEIVGWTTHEDLILQPQRNFGFGFRYAMNITMLNNNLSELMGV